MGTYIRLVDFNNANEKEEQFFNPKNRFQANQKDFEKIPGSPIAYWVSDSFRNTFTEKSLSEIHRALKGSFTGDNERFLRLFHEIDLKNIKFTCKSVEESISSKEKWYPLQKGGEYKKWYGNHEYLINFKNNGEELKNFGGFGERNPKFNFKSGITWGVISSGKPSFRFYEKGFLFSNSGQSISSLEEKNKFEYICGFLNSKIANEVLKLLSPTMGFESGYINKVPIIFPSKNSELLDIESLVQQNIQISKSEWDSRETSWDFQSSPLLGGTSMESAYHSYCNTWRENFYQMHSNEEELNRLFIEIYGLESEMDEKVDLEDITLLKKESKIIDGELVFNSEEIIKQFLSYGVGCIMGRYSLDKKGLIIANSDDEMTLEENKVIIRGRDGEVRHEIENPKFIPDAHGIIPVVKEDVFQNDIVQKIVEFVSAVYGEASLQENLNFIAHSLGKKKDENSIDILRKYFLKDFYKDHLQRYKKRPIYWMMNSGKKDTFSALIYLHRYEENIVGRVRADYLIPYQETLDNGRAYYERMAGDELTTPKDRKDAEKKLKELDGELKELRNYANEVKHIADQKISLDLDDGVKVNYEKFGKILGKI